MKIRDKVFGEIKECKKEIIDCMEYTAFEEIKNFTIQLRILKAKLEVIEEAEKEKEDLKKRLIEKAKEHDDMITGDGFTYNPDCNYSFTEVIEKVFSEKQEDKE